MKQISVNEALKHLEQNDFKTLYFLHGPEKFFHDQFIKAITASIFPNRADRDLNLSIFYGSEDEPGQIIAACLDYPMFSERRLVIVRDFDKLKLPDSQSFEKYVNNPQKTTSLVLSAAEKGRTKLFQTIHKAAVSIECKAVKEYLVGDWVKKRAQTKGYEMDPQAVQLLVNHVGSNLLTLDQELDKLADYKNDTKVIAVDDVERTTGVSREVSLFALQNALARRDLSESLKIAKLMLESGQSVLAINPILFAYFKRLLMVSTLKQRNYNRTRIAETLNLSDFQVRDFLTNSQHFNIQELKGVVEYLNEVDITLKSTNAGETGVLQMLCYKICRR